MGESERVRNIDKLVESLCISAQNDSSQFSSQQVINLFAIHKDLCIYSLCYHKYLKDLSE